MFLIDTFFPGKEPSELSQLLEYPTPKDVFSAASSLPGSSYIPMPSRSSQGLYVSVEEFEELQANMFLQGNQLKKLGKRIEGLTGGRTIDRKKQ